MAILRASGPHLAGFRDSALRCKTHNGKADAVCWHDMSYSCMACVIASCLSWPTIRDCQGSKQRELISFRVETWANRPRSASFLTLRSTWQEILHGLLSVSARQSSSSGTDRFISTSLEFFISPCPDKPFQCTLAEPDNTSARWY